MKEGFFIVAIIIAIILSIVIDFCWTKSSLEEIAGKEVSDSTVVWTMLKTGRNK